MSFWSDLFGGNKAPNPATGAQNYLNQIPGTISPYYNPYINAGTSEIPNLQSQYNMLMSNPSAWLSKAGAGYQQSPGYQFQVNQAQQAANQAAAAGGMLGSPQEQQNIASTVGQLANQDYGNYLNRLMGLYGMGLQGGQNLFNTGYNASNELAQSLGNALQSQASLSYAGQANQNMANQGQQGMLMGLLGSLISGALR